MRLILALLALLTFTASAEHYMPPSMYTASRGGITFKLPGPVDVVDRYGNMNYGHSDSNYFRFTNITAGEGQVRFRHNGQLTKLFTVRHAEILIKDYTVFAGVPFRIKCKLTNPLAEKVTYQISPALSDVWYDIRQKFVIQERGLYAFDLYAVEPGYASPGRVYITVR